MQEKIAAVLRAISLGKYQTTMYNKDRSPFMSSVAGGIVTLILLIVICI